MTSRPLASFGPDAMLDRTDAQHRMPAVRRGMQLAGWDADRRVTAYAVAATKGRPRSKRCDR